MSESKYCPYFFEEYNLKRLEVLQHCSRETVVVGGTYQVGDAGEDVRQKDTERMWKAACQHMPSLQVGGGTCSAAIEGLSTQAVDGGTE